MVKMAHGVHVSTSEIQPAPKQQWKARIFLLVAEGAVDTVANPSGCSFENRDLAEQAIKEAAFKLLEPAAIKWGFLGEPGQWQAILADRSTRQHQIVVKIKEGPGRRRYTAELLLDGKAYRAVAA